jgi:hypothetical protein
VHWQNVCAALIFLALVAVAIGACSPKTAIKPEPSEMTVFSHSEIGNLIPDQSWTAPTLGDRVELATVKNERLKTLFDRSFGNARHSALAVGHPRFCGFYWRTYQHESQADASRGALSSCLSYVKKLEDWVPGGCGCRLIMVNGKIVARLSDLTSDWYLPVVMIIEDQTGKIDEIHGSLRSAGIYGENISGWLYDNEGREVCRGSYGVNASGIGSFKISCFDGKRMASGELELHAPFTNHTIVAGSGAFDDGSAFYFLSGLLSPEFKYRRAELIE